VQTAERTDPLLNVPVVALRPGMYVAELDRPWLETPFAVQGFLLRSAADIKILNELCVTVRVCPRRSVRRIPPEVLAPGPHPVTTPSVGLKSEFLKAQVNFESAKEVVTGVFEQLRSGGTLNLAKIRQALLPVIDNVLHNEATMAMLARVKVQSDYTYGHCIACAVWATIVGRHLALDGDTLRTLALGCTLIDVGMSQLPKELLTRAGPLTPDEADDVRGHVARGLAILEESGLEDRDVAAIVAGHHEWWDGSGYPRGTRGRKIPMLARVAGLVDAYDAMITPRPWAPARSSFEAIQELQDLADRRFQRELVEQFTAAIGLFPTGSIVELNSGEVGIVTRQNPTRRLRPEIVLILEADKGRRAKYEILDLMNEERVSNDVPGRWIARELPRGAYDIKAEDFFL
jgi:HD-GYP domain-containing protein (c-di-GMP phosphodiesterase class II)